MTFNGGTVIRSNAFSYDSQLSEVIFNEPGDGRTLTVESTAFGTGSSIYKVTVNRANTVMPANAISQINKNTQYTFGNSINTLDGNWFDKVGKVSDVTFAGPNDLTITKAEGSGSSFTPFKELEGNYYVDSFGSLYKLNEDGTASLIYVSPGTAPSYTVPASITSVSGKTYNVTKISEMAFAKADNIKSLIIENPGSMTIPARTFTESSITKVNNADRIDPKDYAYVSTACDFPLIEDYQEAKLKDKLETQVPVGTDAEGNPAIFHFGVSVTNGQLGEDGVYQYLTGQTALFTVGVNNQSNLDLQDRVVRVYFAFTGDEYSIGNYSIGKSYTVTDEKTGAQFPLTVVKTDQPGIFYYDISGWRPGDTLGFRNGMMYTSPNSAGGNLYVWSESMEKEEAERLKGKVTDPREYLKLHWGTNPVNFTTKKAIKYTPTSSNSYRPKYSVDGTADSDIYVKDYITWSITMNCGNDTNKSEGKDYVCYVDFTDTVKLPNDLIWDPKVIEAIQNGKYRYSTSDSFGSEYAYIYVTIDGVDRQLISVEHEADRGVRLKNIRLTVEEDETGKSLVAVHWRKDNSKWKSDENYPPAELANQTVSFTVSNNNLMVDRQSQLFKILKGEVPLTDKTDNYIKQASVINNHVDTTRHYSFSGDKESEADSPVMNIQVPSGLTMSKDRPRPDDSYYMGGSSKFNITITNTGIIANRQIGNVEDSLSEGFYITADNIMKMFNNEQFGRYLSLEIYPATLCTVVDKTVTNVQGYETAHLVSQNTGVDVPYSGCASEDKSVITSNATLYLSWNENKQLVLKVNTDSNGSVEKECIIGKGGDYPTLQTAFDQIGYVVTYRPKYKVTWNLPDNFVIYGGQKVLFEIPANIKQTTMYLEKDNPGSYYGNPPYVNNTAFAYGHDGTTLIKKASISSFVPYKDLTFEKYASYKGKKIEDGIDAVNHTSIDYTLSFVNYRRDGDSWVEHYTSGTYDVLPLVDKLQGSQILLVKEADARDATWQETSDSDIRAVYALGLPTYEENGTNYYVINKPGIYKKLKTGSNYTDTVTVRQTESGLETFIRWYFTNVTPQLAARTATYKVLVDATLSGAVKSGDGTAPTQITFSNESWLGDHQTHRLYDSVSGAGGLIKFSKRIQNDDGSTASHSVITNGDEATYKISLENTSDSEMVIDGSHMYDELPSTKGTFAWSKANVTSVTYEAEKPGSECLTPGKEYWNVDGIQPVTGADTSTEGQYYIHWNNDFKIKFAPKGKVNIYVKLQFPSSSDVTEDGDPDDSWDRFITKVAGGSLFNTFYFDHVPDQVSHELSDQTEAVLKKGVYDTGWVRSTSSSSDTERCEYSSHESRWYYQNGSGLSDGACITYYAVLYNSGNARLYLEDLQDTLPKGFRYSSMADQDTTSGKTGQWWSWKEGRTINNRTLYSGNAYLSSVNSVDTESDVDSNNGSGSRESYKLISAKDGNKKITFVNANVSASKTSDKNGIEHLTFKVIAPRGAGSEGPAIHYDKYTKKYYLNPGEALRFGYNCFVDTWRKTDDTALNAISMPFYDKYGLGLRKNETMELTARKKLRMADNNGNCEIISNAEAVSLYGHTGKTDSTQWLSSNVTVLRQKITPGIKKTVGGVSTVPADLDITETTVLGSKSTGGAAYGNAYSGTTSFKSIVNWKLEVFNESPYTGENSMSEFTITDKVDAPYAFTGQVFYKITGPNNTSTTYNNAYIPLFTLGARSEGDTKVRIVEGLNVFNQYNKDTITVNGPAKEYNNFSVQLLRDEEGCETLIVKFTKPKVNYAYPMVIPADGKMEICVHTQYNSKNSPVSSTLYNSAILMPEQEYASTMVSQGKPLLDEQTSENKGIQSGASVTLTAGFATSASKSITEIGNEKNTANSENDKNYISLNDKAKPFRYDLIVNGPENDPMSKLVVVDSLPQEGDHSPFVDRDKRDSEFKVSMLEEELGVKACVIANAGKGNTTNLDYSQYTVEVNEKTDFDDDDWKGKGTGWSPIDLTDGMSDEEKALVKKARSIRFIIVDETLTVMPQKSRVKISFNAKIDGPADPGEFAWNSFGYSYTVSLGLGFGGMTLNAEPEKVGVHIPSIPRIIKDVVDKDDNTTNVARDFPFEAIIYTGAPIDALNASGGLEIKEIASILRDKKRNVLYVPLTVKKGDSSVDTGFLDGEAAYTYDEEKSEWVRTDTAWKWTNGSQYTVLELIMPDERGYEVKSIAGNMSNNTSFIYNNSIRLRIGVTNRFTDYRANLVITKNLDGYYNGGDDSNVAAAFKITGKDYTGKEVYTNYAGLNFSKGDKLSKTVTIENVPINLDLTVEEVYSGNYKPEDGATHEVQYSRKDNLWTVTFDNTHLDKPHTGSGVVNKYVDGSISEQQGLITDGNKQE